MIFAPLTPSRLPPMLQMRIKQRCQGVLTAGRRARGAVLDGGQGGIRLEEVSHNLCALHLQVVSTQPANESQRDASRGADSSEKGMRLRTSAFATLSCS